MNKGTGLSLDASLRRSFFLTLAALLWTLPVHAQMTTWSVGAWHRGATTTVKSYGYVGAMVQGRFFPAAPHGPKWLFIVRQEGP